MPAKKPLIVDSGVLKSPCASIQTTPQPAWSKPESMPMLTSQDPASTKGSCPAQYAPLSRQHPCQPAAFPLRPAHSAAAPCCRPDAHHQSYREPGSNIPACSFSFPGKEFPLVTVRAATSAPGP